MSNLTGDHHILNKVNIILLNNNHILKLIIALAFLLLTFNIVLLGSVEPPGFTTDIYTVIPSIYYPSIMICFMISSLGIFSKSYLLKCSSVLLLFSIILSILIIPYVFDYFLMGRGDDMDYIGQYLHISNSGHYSRWIVYPSGPIFGATISLVSGISPYVTPFIIPIFFSIIFSIGLFLFSKQFNNSNEYKNIVLLSSFILYLGMYNFLNTPHALYFAFIPLYLYILIKYIMNNNLSYTIIAIITSLLIPFTHPFILFFTVVFLFVIQIISPLLKLKTFIYIKKLKVLMLIPLVTFFTWFMYSGVLLGSFRISIRAFLLKRTESTLVETSEKFSAIALDPMALISFILVYYGRFIIPTIFIVIFLIYYYKYIYKNTYYKEPIKLLIIAYIITLFIELIIFINPIIAHEPDRLTNLIFFIYFQIPLYGLLSVIFINAKSKHSHSAKKKCIVVLVIIITFGLSFLGTFTSPSIQKPNSALTINEVIGMKWVYGYRADDNMGTIVTQIDRFPELFDMVVNDKYFYVSDHFGYDAGEFAFKNFDNYTNPVYITTFQLDISLYEEIQAHKNVGRYTYDDYHKFNCDNSINKIYCGRDMGVSLLVN